MEASSTETVFRRRFPRRKFRRGVGCLHHGIYQVAAGFEIGEGGIAFFGGPEIKEGDTVVLSFQMPRGPFLSVQAEVKNVQNRADGSHLLGCSFRNLRFECKREIRTFVTARTSTEQ